MQKKDEEKIEEIAAKINDGELDISVTEQFDSQDAMKIMQALKKINHASTTLRKKVNVQIINENDKWAHLKIKQKIGQGGIGEVYLAYDSVLNCDVAVKFLQQKSQSYISPEQFLQEARHMAKVRHPHVLAIHGAMIENGIAGYWSDYLDGKTLFETLNTQTISKQQQLEYARQLAEALAQIHKNDIVHGDIKPQNVMLQGNRGAILLDFGSSRQQELDNTAQKIIQASPMAMAPEQFAGLLPSKASDIFSLGLLFWHLILGKHPLDGKDMQAIKNQTENLANQLKKISLNKDWKKLIASMIDVNPSKRPNIEQVLTQLKTIEEKPLKRAKKWSMLLF